MSKTDKFSPNMSLNGSLGLNASIANSPSTLNMSDKFKFLMPDMSASKNRKLWSPFDGNVMKSPNLSPIKTDGSPSPFLKRRDPKDCQKRGRQPLKQIPINFEKPNSNLDMTLSVKTVLKDLKLSHLSPVFDREEINLIVFFTLNDDDLKEIKINDETERKRILDFINDFSTPKKPNKIPRKNVLYRH